MKLIGLLFSILLYSAINCFGQQKYALLKGIVLDSSKRSIESALIIGYSKTYKCRVVFF